MSQGQGRGPLRVVIADDDVLFARMVRAQLSAHPAFEVVGIGANGDEAIALSDELQPDLILMDVYMPVRNGIEAAREIRSSADPPTVVLLTGEDAELNAQAYAAGAAAYLRKSADVVALINVILAMAQVAVPLA